MVDCLEAWDHFQKEKSLKSLDHILYHLFEAHKRPSEIYGFYASADRLIDALKIARQEHYDLHHYGIDGEPSHPYKGKAKVTTEKPEEKR